MHFDSRYFIELLFSRNFLAPAWTAVWFTVASMAIGIVIGTIAGLAATSKSRILHGMVKVFITIFRGTPVLVQIVFWYDGLAELTGNFINLSVVTAGLMALGVNEGAYMTEIVRAGIESVDKGQLEAAHALGLSYRTKMLRVVLPQAVRVAIPPTGNQVISLLKNTSLLFTIAVPEIFATGTNIFSVNFKYFEVLAVVSVWYVGLTLVYGIIQRKLEKRSNRSITGAKPTAKVPTVVPA
ncbi:MAG: amino acid ABC transporter permease [Candidatus Korobacteraceae bacterium]